MSTKEKRYNPVVLLGGVVIVAIVGVLVIRSFTREVVAIRVASVTHQDLVSSVSTNGKVEPIEEFQAHAPAAGVIEQIYVDVGQRVKAGQLLIKMDDADAVAHIASANASLRSAEAASADLTQGGSHEELINLRADLARAKQQQQQASIDLAALEGLQRKGAASPSEVESARQRLQSADTSLQALQQRAADRYSATDRSRTAAQIAEAKAALASAQSSYAGANIRAPFAGTVYSIPVSQYDFVPAGDDLLDVADLKHIQIRAYFDEPEIGRLAVGQPVKIVWEAKPLMTWHGHISRAPTTVITYNTRNVGEGIIAVDDAMDDLPPNSNVTVTVTTRQSFNVLSIPREALHTVGKSDFVYRVIDRKLVRTPVQIGVVNLNRVEITGGLTEKDIVALNATSNRDLSDGLAVRPVQ